MIRNRRMHVSAALLLAIAGAAGVSAQVQLSISPAAIPGGTVGVSYSTSITVSGGFAPYAIGCSNCTVPGLTFVTGATGITISGTPTVAGSYNFTVSGVDSQSNSASRPYALTISSPAPSIVVPALPNGSVNVAYPTAVFTGMGGTAPYTWSLSSGSLPPGLTLNPSTGAVAGTPTAPGTYPFVVRLTDSAGFPAVTPQLSITIVPQFTIQVPSLPSGTVSVAYPSATFTATGGSPPYNWYISSGSLPPGIVLNPQTGALSGIPTTRGTYQFVVSVYDTYENTATTPTLTIVINQSLQIAAPSLPNGTVDVAYPQAQFTASGGATPYTFSIASGSLPSGLTLNPQTGILAGTPTVAGTSQFVVRVVDAQEASATTPTLSLTIRQPLQITAPPLPGGTVNVGYPGAQFAASGGVSPYTYSVSSGSLPAGLTLNPQTGVLAGTPTVAGTSQFVVRVFDAQQASATTQTLTITVNQTLQIAAPSLPSGTVNVVYPGAQFTASGGVSPYTYSIASGSLPAGLTLNPQTGVIAGTPTVAGTSQFVVRVFDAHEASATTQTLTITVNQTLQIAAPSLPSGTVNVVYPGVQFTASGGVTPYTYSIASGSLPAGLTLNPQTGVIAGTPTVAGTSQFVVRVFDAQQASATTQTLTITVNQTLQIAAPSLPSGTVNVVYPGAQFTASGGVSPYTYSIASGSLPAGLTLNPQTGVIAGTPTVAGTSQFVVRVFDAHEAFATTQTLTITVNQTLQIAAPPLPSGTVNVVYPGVQFTASGGVTPYIYSISFGSLPAGLTLNPQTGVIAGTPTVAGTSQFVVRVFDAQQASATTQTLTITVNQTLQIAAPPLPSGTVNVVYPGAQFTASGGVSPYTYSISFGSLPAGLTLNPQTGVIAGTPTVAGTSQFVVRVFDAHEASATTQALTLTVNQTLRIVVPFLPGGTVGVAYSTTQFTGLGGTPPYTFSISYGSLPAGLALNPQTGVVSGTPFNSGSAQFVVSLTDAQRAVATTQLLTITINQLSAGLQIAIPPLPNGTVNVIYPPAQFTGSGGTAPYSFSVVSGSLPAGLTLNPQTGILTGTPTVAGTYQFVVRLMDAREASTTTQSLALTIGQSTAGFRIALPPLPNGIAGVAYPPSQFVALGGSGHYTWSVQQGVLPAGLALNAATGILTGVPTTAGLSSFVVGVTDSGQSPLRTAVTPQLTIVVSSQKSPLAISVPGLPNGTTGVSYGPANFAPIGGAAPYAWSISQGSLPPGLSLNASTGTLGGTPTAPGTSQFVVQLQDHFGLTATTALLSLTVNSPNTIIRITVPALPPATVTVPYSPVQFTATGGTLPYSWAVSGGSLPPGMSLDPVTGTLAGAPSSTGTFQFVATVTDVTGLATATSLQTLSVPRAPSIGTPVLPIATVNVPYPPVILVGTGGLPPYTWSVSQGSLPPGISLDPKTGTIAGTPTAVGTYPFQVSLKDSNGLTATSQTLIIAPAGPLAIGVPALPSGTVGVAYPAAQFTGSGGVPPYTWTTIIGSLPPGLSLDAKTGLLSGTPTVAGTSQFAVMLTDARGAVTTSPALSLTVAVRPPLIEPVTLPPAVVGAPYNQTLPVSGSGPFTWSIVSGAPPAGITLSPSGVLNGTATVAGTFTFTVQVTDANQAQAQTTLTLQSTLPALPGANFTGPTATLDPAVQPTFSLLLNAPYTVTVTGIVTLSFTSNAVVPVDDPAIQFSTGGRTVAFTIPAGQTAAVFTTPQVAFSTGTVAGTITLTATFKVGAADVTPSPAPSRSFNVALTAPKITSVTIQSAAGGFTVVVTGFSTPRQVASATFNVTIAGGSTASSTINVDLGSVFSQWYQSSGSAQFGSGFVYTQPFTLSGTGSAQSVTVTLTNAQGSSPPVTN